MATNPGNDDVGLDFGTSGSRRRYDGTVITDYGTNVTWAESRKQDLGVEFRTLNDKLSVTADHLQGKTYRRVPAKAVPFSFVGLNTNPWGNLGEIENKGFDATIELMPVKIAPEMTLDMRATFTYNRDKVLENDQPKQPFPYMERRGTNYNAIFGYVAEGLFVDQAEIDKHADQSLLGTQRPGDIKYKDMNGDGFITEKDKRISGNPNPQGNYFINFTIGYKGFELETQVNGFTNSLGYYGGRYQVPLNLTSTYGGTPMTFQTDYWTPENTGASLPRITPSPGNNVLPSDFWLTDAAFVRVRYIQLGYTVNPALTRKIKLNNLRLYVNAQNPFTFSKMKHLDPETRGDEANYPLMKVFTFGINVKF